MAKTKVATMAQEIRKELKETFPNTKFSVRSDNYSGGGSVRVRWTDFPTVEAVKEVTSKHEDVHRDEYTGEILLGANWFVFEEQDISDELREKAKERLPYGIENDDPLTQQYWSNEAIKEMYEEVKHQYEAKYMEDKKKASNKPKKGSGRVSVKEENKEKPATKKQLWALHCITGINTKELEITRSQASDLIARSKKGEQINDIIAN